MHDRKFPFDWEHILALVAPSPTLLQTALNDPCFPKTRSCGKAVELAREVYNLLGAPEAIENIRHSEGHRMTVEGLEAADDWFDRWL